LRRRAKLTPVSNKPATGNHKIPARIIREGAATAATPGTVLDGATVTIVSVSIAGLAPSVSTGGLNVNVAFGGKPATENCIGPVNPPTGVTVNGMIAVCPA